MNETSLDVTPPLAAWFGAEAVELHPLGAGHINGTWRVKSATGDFVLQQISSSVFPQPRRIAANQALLIAAATAAKHANTESWGYQLPEPLPAANGETLVFAPIDADASTAAEVVNTATQLPTSAWRLCPYFAGTRTLQTLDNVTQARAAGRAFGELQTLARNIDAAAIQEVIPGFYQLAGYQQTLTSAWENCAEPTPQEQALMGELVARSPEYAHPATDEVSVIHGDCKVNNLLFAEDADTVVAILDLDTLMTGAWWLDFGDLVRSAAFDARKRYLPDFYAAVAEGFFAGCPTLRQADLAAAVRAPAHVGYMLAIRFFTDHLQGDKYFKVQSRGQNLERALSQFAQLEQLEQDDCKRSMIETLTPLLADA